MQDKINPVGPTVNRAARGCGTRGSGWELISDTRASSGGIYSSGPTHLLPSF